jgi:hypothetical protein
MGTMGAMGAMGAMGLSGVSGDGGVSSADFVDLTTNQSIAGIKTFTENVGLGTTTPAFCLDATGETDAFGLPSGTTTQRPKGATAGALRFNTDFGGYEISLGGFWFRQDPMLASDSAATQLVVPYTGADQTIVVPPGVSFLFVKVWGAGGAGGTVGGWSYGSEGGGGGHVRGVVPVVAGETLRMVVGQGGVVNMAQGYTYGGGASAAQNGNDNRYGGGGGGYSGLFRGTQPLLIAGGGGGGGSSRAWTGNAGGAGGGLTGQRGESPYVYQFAGNPGTQTAGGAAAPPSVNCATGGQAGTSLQGGHAACNCYGGGGGGGYFGGAGGGYVEPNTMAGGGGGSGFIDASVKMGVALTGEGRHPAMANDPDLSQLGESNTIVAHGGSVGTPGANGSIVIYY